MDPIFAYPLKLHLQDLIPRACSPCSRPRHFFFLPFSLSPSLFFFSLSSWRHDDASDREGRRLVATSSSRCGRGWDSAAVGLPLPSGAPLPLPRSATHVGSLHVVAWIRWGLLPISPKSAPPQFMAVGTTAREFVDECGCWHRGGGGRGGQDGLAMHGRRRRATTAMQLGEVAVAMQLGSQWCGRCGIACQVTATQLGWWRRDRGRSNSGGGGATRSQRGRVTGHGLATARERRRE